VILSSLVPVLVTGGAGQLAGTFARRLSAVAGVTFAPRTQLNIADGEATRTFVGRLAPGLIINCAAYNNVDDAEDDPDAAMAVNAAGVLNLASAAAEMNATFVHYSTDFVFDGFKPEPYDEADVPNPLSRYGLSKLAGERHTTSSGARHYVLRLSSLYGGEARSSFIDRIISLASAGQPVPAFVNRTVTPSYAPDVVDATIALVEHEAPSGIYHCTSSTWCTWHDLAAHVLKQAGRIDLLRAVEFVPANYRAPRPQYCALSSSRLASFVGPGRPWQSPLDEYLTARARHG
jgi:dTDP-4-dehydrorhamnose reductase